MTLRVALVDDHHVIRSGLRELLGRHEGIEIAGEAGTGRDALELVSTRAPDIVLMDVVMPDLNGIEATRQLATLAPDVAVIILSMHRDRQYVEAAIEAGAAGYVVKDSMTEELIDVIERVGRGERPCFHGVEAEPDTDEDDGYVSLFDRLTPRELEVLQLFAEGRTTKEVAFDLGMSPKTVETHRARLYRKLECKSLVELTHVAIREGLIEPKR